MSWLRIARFALLALPILLPTYGVRFHIGPLPTTLLEVFVLATIGVCVMSSLLVSSPDLIGGSMDSPVKPGNDSKSNRNDRRATILALAWIAVTLLAAFVAPDIIKGLGLWRAYALEPVLLFFCYRWMLVAPEDHKWLRRSLWLALIPTTVAAIFQYTTGHLIPHPWNVSILDGRRATGLFLYPNALALWSAPIGALAIACWIKSKRNWLALAAWIMALVSIVLARSEGGLLALGCVTVIALLTDRLGRYVAGALVALGIASLALFPGIRAQVIHEATFQGWSGYVRLKMWHDTWQMLKDHLYLGAGLGGYPTMFKPYQSTTGIEVFQYPHQIVLTLWSEVGLPGLLVFLAIVGVWIKQHRGKLIVLAPLIAMLVHGLVDVPYFKNDLAILFWLFLALALYKDVAPAYHPDQIPTPPAGGRQDAAHE